MTLEISLSFNVLYTGEIYQWRDDGTYDTVVAENTYSLNLKNSWTNSTITWHAIPKGQAPSLNNEALWLGPSGESFYMYDGGISGYADFSPPANAVWNFAPFDAGGSWYRIGFDAASKFSGIARVDHASYASGSELSFALNGVVSGSTTTALSTDDSFTATGLVCLDNTRLNSRIDVG